MNLLFTIFFIFLSWNAVHCGVLRQKVFFLQRESDNDTLLVVTWAGDDDDLNAGCEVFKDQELIKEVLDSSDDKSIKKITEDEINILLEECVEFSLRRKRKKRQIHEHNNRRGFWKFWEKDSSKSTTEQSSDFSDQNERSNISRNNAGRSIEDGKSNNNTNSNGTDSQYTTPMSKQESTTTEGPSSTEGYSGWPVIWIGTKWCGAGDIAKHYDDLGVHADTDKCCRAHDLCNHTIAPGQSKHNLTNQSLFTKLSCKCDDDFYDCLNNVDSVIANTIGNLYFNILDRECYDQDYPNTSKCRNYRSFFKIKCEEFEKDTSAPKVFQWVPSKKYKKIPAPGPLSITLPF